METAKAKDLGKELMDIIERHYSGERLKFLVITKSPEGDVTDPVYDFCCEFIM